MRALAILATVTACSFSVGAVPRDYRARRGGPPPPCESAFIARGVADGLGATVFAFLGYLAYGFSNMPCAPDETCDRKVSEAVPWLIPTALYLGAIAYGVVVTHNCSGARDEYVRLQR